MNIKVIKVKELDEYLDISKGLINLQINSLWNHIKTRKNSYVYQGKTLTNIEFKYHFLSLINKLLLPINLTIICKFRNRNYLTLYKIKHKIKSKLKYKTI